MNQKLSFSINFSSLRKNAAPLLRHLYFAFIIVLLAGLGLCIYLLAGRFNADDSEYRTTKETELLRDVRIRRDDATVDRLLQLETANTGPIQPDYVPSRDNPFKE